ncbi:hypothetical protein ABZX90_09725 [Streptomyces sp. NPDC002935]|uniref:hypothetical protein n=1 Tax=Streptomyces sp. NPDC002935 TaxID=3154545 RepID=UPI0033A18213
MKARGRPDHDSRRQLRELAQSGAKDPLAQGEVTARWACEIMGPARRGGPVDGALLAVG